MKARFTRFRERLGRQDGGLFLSVLGGIRWSVLFRISGAASGFLIALLSARLLEVEAYGNLQYVLGVLNIAFILGGLGLAKIIIRETAIGATGPDWSAARGLLRFAVTAGVVATLLAGVAGYWAVIRPGHAELAQLYALGLLLFVLRQVLLPLASFLNGLQRILQAGLGDVLRDLIVVAVLGILWLASPRAGFDEETVMLIRIAAAGVSLLVLAALFLRVSAGLPGGWSATPPRLLPGAWLKTGLPLMLVATTSAVFHNADVMMLGLMRGSEEVALYHAATRSQGLIEAALVITLMPLAPVISSLFHRGDLTGLRGLVRKTTLLSVLIALPVAVALTVFAAEFLALFGEEFRAAERAMQILVASMMLSIPLGPSEHLLIMTRYQAAAAVIAGLAAALNVGLNFWLIPLYGPEGAAVATAISALVLKLALWYHVRRRIWSGIPAPARGA